ncbi:PssD/Cps14F family polysaccharide biosynthesis glycosyltransferase [Actinomycetospora aeridis]|uniref:PssD/Cps14F family polysaccharide biosynthesis glycosyltransferase n=1 Tax=Actinomycetospora aeridis TaxID=3129231 RepID=A0ABU8N685_9PSEU
MTDDSVHVLLVASGGGHLAQLLALRPWWQERHRTWVTSDNADTRSQLEGEVVIHAFFPTTRNVKNLLRNSWLAFRTIPVVRPDLVVSTGAAVAVPFFLIARSLRIPTVFIEVFDRIESRTLTGRLCYPIADVFMVQWDEQQKLYPRAHVVGALM